MKPTEASFLRDVASHEMIVIHDDGVHRHIRFKKPGTGCMHFDIVTWPGYLAYSGDMGCYVFSRLTDMFQFFRTDRKHMDGRTLAINLGYWAEKLQAVDRGKGSAEEFCEEKFNRVVVEYLVRWIRDNAYQTTKEERRDLWEAVTVQVIGSDGDSGGHRKQIAAYDFGHKVNRHVGDFYFQDLFEYNFTEYTYHFIWCCYAIAWGVQKYDMTRAA